MRKKFTTELSIAKVVDMKTNKRLGFKLEQDINGLEKYWPKNYHRNY